MEELIAWFQSLFNPMPQGMKTDLDYWIKCRNTCQQRGHYCRKYRSSAISFQDKYGMTPSAAMQKYNYNPELGVF